jgi:DNA replication factor Dna2
MRHQLFEETMKKGDFTVGSISSYIKAIVRKNSEGILGCGTSSIEAEKEILKFIPQIIEFAKKFTSFGPSSRTGAILENQNGDSPTTHFVAEAVEVVEEPLISPELGLKGNIDMIVRARIGQSDTRSRQTVLTSEALLGIELKTGHNQKTQNAHLAQLSMYILIMKCRYGSNSKQASASLEATESGLLLYLNNDSLRAVHVSPLLSEIKSLIGQRNLVAIEQVRASRPRGIVLSYEQEKASSNVTIR